VSVEWRPHWEIWCTA